VFTHRHIAFSVIEIQQKSRSRTNSFLFCRVLDTTGRRLLRAEKSHTALVCMLGIFGCTRTLHLMCVFTLFGINYFARASNFALQTTACMYIHTLCVLSVQQIKLNGHPLPLHISLKYGLCLFAFQSANSTERMKRAFLFISCRTAAT